MAASVQLTPALRSDAAMQDRHPVLASGLIVVAFALLVSEHLFHYPVAIMALWALVRLIGRGRGLRGAADARLLTALFLCIWLPMLVALPDAVQPTHTAKTALLYAHFLPAAWFVLDAARDSRVRTSVLYGVCCLAAFLCLDALMQAVVGRDIFGYPNDGPILKGAFYPKQRLGLVLAVFAPLCFEGVRRTVAGWRWSWILLVPLLLVITLSLKRTAWIMLAVGVCGFGWLLWRQGVRPRARRMIAPVIGLAAVAVTVFMLNPTVSQRADQTMDLLAGDIAAVDRATSYRLSLWRTGRAIFLDNWVNGIGPRGFRHAYRAYASPDDFWLQRGGNGQTHPHLMLMEVLVEAGVVGLLGYIVFWVLLLGTLARSCRDATAAPWLLAATVAWFPLNAHLAFYGSYWSTVAWLLLPLGLARAGPRTGM